MNSDSKAGLSKPRWDEYRRVFSRNGIRLGIERDTSRDAFIVVGSIGILNRGHATEYVYCNPTAPLNQDRCHPCALNQDEGHHENDPRTRDEA